jgi:predicted transcriptional regulator
MAANSKFLENYDLVEPTIRKLYDSRFRIAIIDALSKKPMRLADLRRAVNSNAPNTSSKAKELEGMGMVERVDGDYQLTPYGQAVRGRMQDSFEFYTTYEKFKEFWIKHETSGIPNYLWIRLGDLSNSNLVLTTPIDVTGVHDSFVVLLNSIKKRFYGVSPIYQTEYLDATHMMVEKGVDVKLVLTTEVAKICAKALREEGARLFDKSKNCEMCILDNLNVAFTVSEAFLSFALKSKHLEASYMDMDLQSYDQRVIQWGMDLFEYYRKQAKPIKMCEYL